MLKIKGLKQLTASLIRVRYDIATYHNPIMNNASQKTRACKRHKKHRQYQFSFSAPNHPLASTREHAVVGVGGTPRPINDLVLPCERKVATLGVAAFGKGTRLFRFEVRVMVDGVRVVDGDGGKTKSV